MILLETFNLVRGPRERKLLRGLPDVRDGMTLAWKLDKTHAHGYIISGLYLGIAVFVVEEGWA